MKKQHWKIAFFSLLTINIIIVGTIGYFIFSPGTSTIHNKSPKGEKVNFKINTSKNDLTKLINHYIHKEGLNGPIDYSVQLTDEVELYGLIKIFSQDVQLKMTFEPEAQKNGDLLLKQKSILIGNLNLPVEYVLKFIQKSYKFPDWVTIQPNKKTIYVALQSMKVNNEMIVHADRFDLKNDDISFTLQIPTK
ncbi:YpmS family protein [Heyndrickxia vini]|uniref:YpmS family protein n=1 Tax=Heyndrickxia vini TaxID=1476025 RepID=A0ABX7E723_9BACI|nr:YpmS family protein [Heyndrickxia vini]QQZ11105.1 YpmS family protein [Heyndrickxia vini]